MTIYPVETKVVIQDDVKYLCHAYHIESESRVIAERLSDSKKEVGVGSNLTKALHNAIEKFDN